MPKSPLVHLFALSLFLCTSCGSEKGHIVSLQGDKPPYSIELARAEEDKGEVLLSDFAKSITYVKLESNPESLIARDARFYLTDKHIISIAFRQIYVFDRNDGKFVKEVRSYGEGPDQYRNTYPFIHIHEEKQVVYASDHQNKRIGLDADGQEQFIFETPSGNNTFVSGIFPVTEKLYAGYHANYDCKQELKLILFDENGKVVKTYDNELTCINEQPDRISFNTGEGLFYGWNNQTFFKELFNDTLYRVSEESLDFHAVFINDNFSLPYEKKTSLLSSDDLYSYFRIIKMDETADFIFFTLMHKDEQHSAFYDKQKGETKVSYNETSEINYFTNNLDDFLPFSPQYATNDGKLVGYLEAPYVVEWFEMNPEKAAALPEQLRRFAYTSEDDNPIVMIVDTKD